MLTNKEPIGCLEELLPCLEYTACSLCVGIVLAFLVLWEFIGHPADIVSGL